MAITNEQVERINELARKKKAEGLSEAELEEQALLRRAYLDSVKEWDARLSFFLQIFHKMLK